MRSPRLNAQFGELCADFGRSGRAVVAVVEGTAMGGGFGLACAADVTLAGESAVFRLPETSLGVVPAQIAPYLVERLGLLRRRGAWPSRRPHRCAARTRDRPRARTASRCGARRALAAHAARDPAERAAAVAATKALIAKARLHSPASLVQEAAEVFSRAALSAEGTEGRRRFCSQTQGELDAAVSFGTILIANRGEIACRVIRTARALGYRTVAVFSDADADALHVRRQADAAVHRRRRRPESHLNAVAIVEAARRSGADAIHPGYGFLSENASFAQACLDAGWCSSARRPRRSRAMGDKAQAKRRMHDAGVPCAPGVTSATRRTRPRCAPRPASSASRCW